MFSATELAAMTAEVGRTLGPESGLGASIILHRGETVLLEQAVRLVRPGGMSRGVIGDGTEGKQVDVYLVGGNALDIQARDRFALDGHTYEVNGVHPLRQIDTVASARLLQ